MTSQSKTNLMSISKHYRKRSEENHRDKEGAKFMFRRLRADEIDCRVQSASDKGLSLLLYKDARCDMNILDETVGCLNWQRTHSRDNSNCTVSIYNKDLGEWVSKEDTGTDSNTEAEKGRASDSFKRACVNWGIGRELYTAPFIWINKSEYTVDDKGRCKDRFYVSDIGYDKAGNINRLVIYNKNRKRKVFSLGSEIAGYPSREEMIEVAKAHYPALKMDVLLESFGIDKIEDASTEQLAAVYNKYKK